MKGERERDRERKYRRGQGRGGTEALCLVLGGSWGLVMFLFVWRSERVFGLVLFGLVWFFCLVVRIEDVKGRM